MSRRYLKLELYGRLVLFLQALEVFEVLEVLEVLRILRVLKVETCMKILTFNL